MKTNKRNERESFDRSNPRKNGRLRLDFYDRSALEHHVFDPKESELYLDRLKSKEILMEGHQRSDAQIDVQI